jgi:signal transduction histidine kinase
MGFGLGLAIASELCESHLGELRLRNADDGGLIAEMWLPR